MTQLITIPVTTDASGNFSKVINTGAGRLLQYRYIPAQSNALATGADIDLVGTTSGLVLISQDDIGTSAFTKAPRQAVSDSAGAASLYASGGTAVQDHIYLGGESLTFTVAQGGNAKSGTFYFWIG